MNLTNSSELATQKRFLLLYLTFSTLAIFTFLIFLLWEPLHLPLGQDAQFLTTRNRFVKDIYDFWSFWRNDFFYGAETYLSYPYYSGYYRPVSNLVLKIIYLFADTNAFYYNVSCLFLHCCNVFLLAIFAYELGASTLIAFLAASIFALHPINSFVITRPEAIADLLMPLFYLSTLVLYSKSLRRTIAEESSATVYLILSIFTFILCFFSKESALSLPIALAVLHYFKFGKDRLWKLLIFLVPFICYFFLRFYLLDLKPNTDVAGYSDKYTDLIIYLNLPKSFVIYLCKLIFPLGAKFPDLFPYFENYIEDSVFSVGIIFSLVVCLIIFLSIFATPTNLKLLICLLIISFSPLLGVKSMAGTMNPDLILTQERWAYLACAIFSLIFAFILEVLFRKNIQLQTKTSRRVFLLIFLCLLGFYSRQLVVHASETDSDRAQYRRYQRLPPARLNNMELSHKHILYAELFALRRNDMVDAEKHLQAAIKILPESPVPVVGLAYIYSTQQQWTDVISLLTPWENVNSETLIVLRKKYFRVLDDYMRVKPQIDSLLQEARKRQ